MLSDLHGYAIPTHRPCCKQCALTLSLIASALETLESAEIRLQADGSLPAEAIARAIALCALGRLDQATADAAKLAPFAFSEPN